MTPNPYKPEADFEAYARATGHITRNMWLFGGTATGIAGLIFLINYSGQSLTWIDILSFAVGLSGLTTIITASIIMHVWRKHLRIEFDLLRQ
jgi:predicted membrane channel-forming protein YqfA (hemolysin III family)